MLTTGHSGLTGDDSDRQPVYRLAVITGPDAGREFVIPARGGGIGRGHWNAIQLTDSQVSRSHCLVERHDGQHILTDVGSFSGTRVNGQPITRHALDQGDVISIGNTRLAFMPPEPDGDWSNERTDMHAPTGAELLGGRYEILSLVGVGGMGSVYRVRDRELDEVVALKALKHELSSSPSMRTHFRREVKLARRVTHKNVARIFDIGEHHGQRFLTMEFIDGEPLTTMLARRGALPVRAALDIALELCSGLAAAHSADVVHRDLKPDNILIALDGRVVITDFGIALDPAVSTPETAAMAGTPTYMAPELLQRGASSGPHTDIYSLGCVIYEMVIGAPAWSGASQVEIATARLFAPPPDPRAARPEIGADLAAVILRCMDSDPAARFASAAQVRAALRRVEVPEADASGLGQGGSTSNPALTIADVVARAERRVAVIPFDNDGDGKYEYLAEALTGELFDTLSLSPGLLVAPRAQVEQSRTTRDDLSAIGRALDVQVIMTGRVESAPGDIRVHARLVNVADGFQLWAKSFEFATSNQLVISDEVVSAMIDALALSSQAPAERTAADAKAIELYLRGRTEYRKFWPESVARALEYFEGARELVASDPAILAACAMARARMLYFRGGQNDAATLARQAIDVAPHQAESHLALAMARFYVNDLEVALREGSLAMALSPTLAEAHLLVGRILMECGPLKDAERTLEQATMLDPQLYLGQRDLAHTRLLAGHGPTVIRDSMNEMPRRPDAIALRTLEMVRMALWLGDPAAGREALEQLERDGDEQCAPVAQLCRAIVEQLEDPETPWQVPDELREGATGSVRRRLFCWQLEAEVAAFRGDSERLVDVLIRADDAGFADINWLEHCPLLHRYRQTERMASRAATASSPSPSRSPSRSFGAWSPSDEIAEIRQRIGKRANQMLMAWRRL